MHSITVKSTFDSKDPKDPKWINVTWTIKTTYSFKLCYPTGIEYDLPKSYRSVNQFIFVIDKTRPVFVEHWKWLVNSIQENYDYEIYLDKSDAAETVISHKDNAITFSLSTNGCGDEFRMYLPLEYVKEEFLNACREMIAIYESKEGQTILDEIKTAKYKRQSKYDISRDIYDCSRWEDNLNILAIHPNEFPTFIFKRAPGHHEIIYCRSHASVTNHIYISSHEMKKLLDWLENSDQQTKPLMFFISNRKPVVEFEFKESKNSKYLQVAEYLEDYGHYGCFDIHISQIPKLQAFLKQHLN